MDPNKLVSLSEARADVARILHSFIDRTRGDHTPRVIGICGPQGSGKSTACSKLQKTLVKSGYKCALLSLDDFYLTHSQRLDMAKHIHPLFATRGVPGTHDVALAARTVTRLLNGEHVPLPRFDKATDTRAPASTWPVSSGTVDVVLLEGWCVGARPQYERDLQEPLNELERTEDPNGVWRRHVNTALQDDYQHLFSMIDALCFIRAPDFDIVYAWRQQQEADLRANASTRAFPSGQCMSKEDVVRFVTHFERLTRHIAFEMPHRADIVIQLNALREIESVKTRSLCLD